MSPVELWRRYDLRLALLTVVTLALRLIGLGDQLLWRDEVFTAVVTQKPLGDMVAALRIDSAPPLAYLLTHAVTALWSGPVALRLVPVLAGTAAVPLAAALARRCAGDLAGLCAGAFVAVAPSFLSSARDARMYALADTLVLASALTLWRLLERPGWQRALVHALVVACAVNTQYLAVPAIAAQLVALNVVLRPPWRALLRTLGATAAGGLLLVPWLLYAHGQTSHLDTPFWTGPVDVYHVGGMAAEFLNGPSVSHTIDNGVAILTLEGIAVVGGALGLLGAMLWARTAAAQQRRRAAYVAGCVLAGWLLLVLVSLRVSFIEGRYASVFWGPLAAIVGIGWAALPRVVRGVAAVCAAAGVIAVVPLGLHPEAHALLSELPQAGAHDLVAADPGDYLLLLYYDSPAQLQRTHVIAASIAWWWGVAAFPPDALAPQAPPDVAANNGTIYVVWSGDESVPPLPGGYRRTALSCRSQICVATYQP